MTGLLAGRRILVTGVLTPASIAYAVAQVAQREGARVVLTARRIEHVRRVAEGLPAPAAVVPLDITDPGDCAALAGRVRDHVEGIDGVLHAIAFGPPGALGGDFLATSWPDVAATVHASTYSLQALVAAVLPLMSSGSAIVGVDFDATRAWPLSNWMGVAKAGLESCARYLARDLGPRGIRINLVACGPLRTAAAHGVPGFDAIAATFAQRAPLGWNSRDPTATARTCVALLSDWLPATTGEIVHADGGFHSLAA